jgi:hypothetical protein
MTKDLNDGYMGSGKYLKRAIKKYGIENFEKYIIYMAFDENGMDWAENQLVVTRDKDSTSYNIEPGGNRPPNHKGRKRTKKWLEKHSGVNHPNFGKRGNQTSSFGSKWFNNGLEEKKIYDNELPPLTWIRGRIKKPPSREGSIPWNKNKNDYITEELRSNFGKGNRGKKRPEHSKRMLGKKYHEGFKHSEESRKIMSIKKIGNKNRLGGK